MGNPSHLPAIEIPLSEPMVLGSVANQVLAPIGFTALFQDHFGNSIPFSIHTHVLLAPVPPGTIVSNETPVIITTIYAVPKLSVYPSFYPIFADFPGNYLQGTTPGTQSKPVDSVTVPISPQEPGVSPVQAKFPTSVPTPATTFHEVS